MVPVKHCLECGAPLGETVPGGLCSTCALRGALELRTAEPPEPEPNGSEADYSTAPRSRLFGDYELLEEIAHGGMGIVYRARQLSLNRIVAVKMIRAERLARVEEVRRFRQEAATAARLQHPNIVAIHEAGECDGQHFYSMDFIEGRSLAELVREHPVAARRAAAHVKTIAEAIQYAHEHGILHRDLKPSNILIDAKDVPRVADFGLAKLLQSESEMTLTGEVMGSPSYMAPEQAGGRGREVDARTDVYALGAILYELMTGRPPFKAQSSLETLKLVAENDPVAPRLLDPSLPRDLETICLKCLEKERGRRYPSAQQVAEELGRFLQGKPILARPLSPAGRAWRCCRRRPVRCALTAALMLAVGAGATTVLWEWKAEQAARRRAETAEHNLTERLWSSYLAEARANRWSGRAGRRFDSLAALSKAAAIRPTLELRNEAIACLALPDVRVERWLLSDPKSKNVGFTFDTTFERYACMFADGRISLCRVSDNSQLKSWTGVGKREKSSLRFSHNGQLLAQHAEGEGGEPYFALWDVERAQLAFSKPMFARGMAFSPDDRQLAVIEVNGGVIHLYDVGARTELTNFAIPPALNHLAYDPMGKRLAVSRDQNPSVLVLDLQTGATCAELKDVGSVAFMSWSPDGQTLACPSGDTRIYLWRVATDTTKVLEGHTGVPTGALFNRLGDMLASTGWDGETRFWDPKLAKPMVSIAGGWLQEGFAPDDRRLGFSISEYEVGTWEMEPARECRRLGRTGRLWVAEFAPSAPVLATGSSDGVWVWDVNGNRLIQHLPHDGAIIWHPNRTNLFVVGRFGLEQWTVSCSNPQAATWLESPPFRPVQCRGGACLCPDGRTLIVANAGPADLLVLDLQESYAPRALSGHPRANSVCISPNGKWFASGTWQGMGIVIWSTETWRPIKELPVRGSATATFSPDGLWLVTGAAADYRFWRTESWAPGLTIPRDHAGDMYGRTAFVPDGHMLALLHGHNRGVKLISVPQGKELATLDTGEPLCFSPDGKLLATAGEDRTSLFVWDLGLIRQQLAAMKLDWE